MKNLRTGFVSFSSALAMLAPVRAFADENKAGLPQLDATMYPEQLFWLAVCFATLYVLMAFVALPGVKRTQDKRQAALSKDLSAAAAANEQAKIMMAQSEKALADARTKAHATVNEIKISASKEAAEKQAAQHKDLTHRLNDAEKKIHTVRNMAVSDAHKNAGELASAIVAKLLGAA